jgi:hypothetical protein
LVSKINISVYPFSIGKAVCAAGYAIYAAKFAGSIQVNRMRLQIIQLANG